MATDDPIRASDSDREIVVSVLREAYTAGRLTLDEFDERMAGAYASKTWGDLRGLTADLPSQPLLGGDVPGRGFTAVLPEPPAPLPPLPTQPPRSTVTPTRRKSPIPMLIPIAVWTILALHAGSGTGFVILSMVLLAVLLSAFRRR